MDERDLRPAGVAAAALAIGGLLVVAQPRRAASVVQLVLAAIAGAAALHALVVHLPPRWWTSPFDPGRRRRADPPGHELALVRTRLEGRRQPVRDGPPLPADVLRTLKPLVAAALEREGVDPDAPGGREAARALLSAPTLGVLATEPLTWPRWLDTRRPDPRAVARAVHRVLDELEGLPSAPLPSARSAPPAASVTPRPEGP